MQSRIKQLFRRPWLLPVLVALGFLLYGIQSIYFAAHLDVTMDEGTYLIKGLYLARGDYQPFQDQGFWMNKMPLAFLLPGWAEMLFSPGLLTGRIFSIGLNLLMLLGLWLAVRNTAGKGWAAAAVWISALNPGLITYYVAACRPYSAIYVYQREP